MNLDYQAIGQRIRAARKKTGLTQEMLAEQVGLSVTHVSNIETAKTKLSLPALVDIANVLNVSADMLLCDSISRSRPCFEAEFARELADCDIHELRILCDTAKAVKQTLRKNKKGLDQK